MSMAVAHFTSTLLLTLLILAACRGEPRLLERHELLSPASSLNYKNTNAGNANDIAVDFPEALRKFRFNAPSHEVIEANLGEQNVDGVRADKEYDVADIALALTVDGAIHAIRRDTGLWIWSMHKENETEQRQEVLRSPVVKSSSRRSLSNGNGDASETTTDSQNSPHSNGSSGIEADDEVYIIEPHSAGDIYVYYRSTAKLQRLPLSITQLVDLSPFTFPSESITGDGKLFVGRKETKLVGIDLQTGTVVGAYGPDAGWCEWLQQSSPKLACAAENEEKESRPWDLLYLGRTDYYISIYSKSQGLLQTLSYTAYGQSSLSANTKAKAGSSTAAGNTWLTSPDNLYIQPMHDGSLVCFHTEKVGFQWTKHFSQPVVGLFDIVFPSKPPGSVKDDDSRDGRAQPVLYPHPHQAFGHDSIVSLQNLPSTTFIGRTYITDDSAKKVHEEYFAMSNEHYPLVTFAPLSRQAEQSTMNRQKPSDSNSGNDTERRILGSHIMVEPIVSGRTIDGSPELSSINRPLTPYFELSSPQTGLPSYYSLYHSYEIFSRIGELGLSTSQAFKGLFCFSGFFTLAFFYIRKRLSERRGRNEVFEKRRNLEIRTGQPKGFAWKQTQYDSEDSTSLDFDKSATTRIDFSSSKSSEKALPALPPLSPTPDPTFAIVEDALGDQNSTFNDTDKAQRDIQCDTAEDDAVGDDAHVSNKKKGRRRKRGKKPTAKPATTDILPAQKDSQDASSISEELEQLQPHNYFTSNATMREKNLDNVGRIGSLIVSDKIIGKTCLATILLQC